VVGRHGNPWGAEGGTSHGGTVSPKRVKRFHVSLTGVVLAAAPTAVMMTLVNFWEEGTEDGSPPRLVVGSVSEQGGKSWSPRWWVTKLVGAEAWWLVGTGTLGVQRVGRVMVATVSPKRVKRFHVSLTGVVLAAAPTAVMMTLVNFWEEGTEDGLPPRWVDRLVSEQGGKTWSPCWWVMKLVKGVAWCQVGREPLGQGWLEVMVLAHQRHHGGHRESQERQEVPCLLDRGGVGGGRRCSHGDPCQLLWEGTGDGGRVAAKVGGVIRERPSLQESVTMLVKLVGAVVASPKP
jgi:hypothetical protein